MTKKLKYKHYATHSSSKVRPAKQLSIAKTMADNLMSLTCGYLHNIYTISTQYLHNIYTISTQYLHNIYTKAGRLLRKTSAPEVDKSTVGWSIILSSRCFHDKSKWGKCNIV